MDGEGDWREKYLVLLIREDIGIGFHFVPEWHGKPAAPHRDYERRPTPRPGAMSERSDPQERSGTFRIMGNGK